MTTTGDPSARAAPTPAPEPDAAGAATTTDRPRPPGTGMCPTDVDLVTRPNRAAGCLAFSRRDAFVLLVAAAVVIGFLLRIAIGATDDAATTDETAYLRSGTALVDGEGFVRDGEPELHFPPLVPLLLGLAGQVFPDPHAGTVWLTILAGTTLILPAALLAHRVAGALAGITTAWVAALAPGLATMPTVRGAGSEAEYALLVVTAVWLAVTSADRRPQPPRLLRVAGAGLLVGLAYLTRPEGLLIALPVGSALAVVAARDVVGRGRQLRAAATTLTAFAVPLAACIVPYAAYLHDHTGGWQLTAKTQDASIEAWHGVASGNREARDQVLYALDESGLRFATERSSLPALARDDLGGYLGILSANVRALVKHVVGFTLLSLPVWLLAGLGAWRSRGSRAVALLAAVGAAPLVTALAFFVQPRYLVVTVAVATVLVGVAVAGLPARYRRMAAVGAVVLVAVPAMFAFRGRDGWWHPNETTDMRAAGEWLEANTGADELIMTRSMVVQFYAERPVLAIPYADVDQIMQFARHYGARYLVADSYTATRLRPQLEPLMIDDRWPGLELVHETHGDGGTTRIFALDPPPPPSDEVGPSLGFIGDG